MSGATLLSRPKKPEGPLEKKLALEDHRPIVRSVGTGQVIGAWIIAWALTVEFALPNIPVSDPGPWVDMNTPPKITVDLTPRDRAGKPVKRKPHENHGQKAASRNPTKDPGNIKVDVLTANTNKPSKSGFEIIKDVMKSFDLDKVERAATLTRTSPTRLAGRPGVKRDAFNPGYADGDGRTNEIDLRPPSGIGTIANQPMKGGERLVNVTTIDAIKESRFRSSESILKAVRSHAPGLRHLYNTYLKAMPGMGGKVTVRFAISPSGLVVDAAVDRGTTGNPEFEEKVLAQIRSWRFDAIKAVGNDIVTVPFNFSE